jgi:hypothetical protein
MEMSLKQTAARGKKVNNFCLTKSLGRENDKKRQTTTKNDKKLTFVVGSEHLAAHVGLV